MGIVIKGESDMDFKYLNVEHYTPTRLPNMVSAVVFIWSAPR